MADIFELFNKIKKDSEAAGTATVSHIVVGLGNPGAKYTFTRHNAGFLTLDYVSQKLNFKIDRLKFNALTGEYMVAGKRVLFMKPQTFMNLSGEAVSAAASFYKIPPENVIVIFDDISLEPGRLRVRRDGSAGGHNGIKSIIEHLGTQSFPRIKMGVGAKPNPDYDLADWVLSTFKKDEQEKLFETFGVALQGLEKILSGDVDSAMQICNSKKA